MVLFATVIEIQMTAILSNADSDVSEPVDPCNNSLTILFSKWRGILDVPVRCLHGLRWGTFFVI